MLKKPGFSMYFYVFVMEHKLDQWSVWVQSQENRIFQNLRSSSNLHQMERNATGIWISKGFFQTFLEKKLCPIKNFFGRMLKFNEFSSSKFHNFLNFWLWTKPFECHSNVMLGFSEAKFQIIRIFSGRDRFYWVKCNFSKWSTACEEIIFKNL